MYVLNFFLALYMQSVTFNGRIYYFKVSYYIRLPGPKYYPSRQSLRLEPSKLPTVKTCNFENNTDLQHTVLILNTDNVNML